LARAGVTANQVTLFAALLSIAWGGAIFFASGAGWPLYLLTAVLFMRMALNAIDGMLAREFGQKSRLGAILNEMGDVVSDAALYLPFAVIPGLSSLLISLVVLLAVMSEMAGAVAVQIGAARRYDGPFGKSDRAVFFGALGLALGAGIPAGPWLEIALGLAVLGSVLTIRNRVTRALAEAQP
jgi:CDP-diacylglycerol--glycerol-3-phosphate 3-phosphatidyltransferase